MTDPIKGISSMATRRILADLAELYQQRTGHRVAITSMGGVDAARMVRAGEATDIVVLASNVMQQLQAEGHILPGSAAGFARSGMAIAVRAGTTWPGIGDEEAVKKAQLSARSIGYSTGPSGDHLMRLWQRWDLVEALSQRAIKAPAGVPVGALVARGEADLGFQQLSELLHEPGIDIVGPLPPEIQAVTVFTVGVCSSSSNVENARDLAAFLTSSAAEPAKRQHGMEPA